MKILFFANTDWYLFNFRLGLARFMRERGFEVVMLSPPGNYGVRLEAAGFRWIALPMQRRSLNPWREAKLLRTLVGIYARERPDIVHHFTIKCVVYGAFAARFVGIRPRVNAVTGLGYVFANDGLAARVLRPFVRILLRLALAGARSRLILQNDDDCSAFERARLIARNKMRLIPSSGVDIERFSPAVRRASESERMRVAFVARLLWEKGVREYIEAASQLKRAGSAIDFLLAGTCDPGNPGSATAADVERWRTERVVRPIGHVEDMAEFLRSIDLMVLPSYREGAPRGVIEAAAAGVPVVTTDVPGCRDVVDHGVTGLLVPSRDASALAAAIRWMAEHPIERERMGVAGRAKMVAEFAEQLVFERTFAVYRELLPQLSDPERQR